MPRGEKSIDAAQASAPRRSTRLSISSDQGGELNSTPQRKRKRKSQSLPSSPSPTKTNAKKKVRHESVPSTPPQAVNKTIEKVKLRTSSRRASTSSIASDSSIESLGDDNVNSQDGVFDLDETDLEEGEIEELSCGTNFHTMEKGANKSFLFSCLGKKIGFDAYAKKKIKEEIGKKDEGNIPEWKEEIVIRIKCEIVFAATEGAIADLDAQRIVKLLKSFSSSKKIDNLMRKEIVELVCRYGNARLLNLIFKEGNVCHSNINDSFKHNRSFLGFETMEELLYYAIDNSCSPEIVLTIASLIYRYAHPVHNGKKFIEKFNYKIKNYDIQNILELEHLTQIERTVKFYKGILSKVIKRGLKDTVLVILGGDIYHCVRLASEDDFFKKCEFKEVYEMVQNVVKGKIKEWTNKADVLDESLIQEKEIKSLSDLKKVLGQQTLLINGERKQIKYSNKTSFKQFVSILRTEGVEIEELCQLQDVVKKLKEHGVETRIIIKVEPVLVGAIISTLFFQEEKYGFILQEKPTPPQLTQSQKSTKDQELKKLKNEELQKNAILELIKSLNKSNHVSSNWFFKEILVDILSDGEKSDKLKKFCAFICAEPMKELLEEEGIDIDTVDKEVRRVLEFVGVNCIGIELPQNTGAISGNECIPTSPSNNTNEKGLECDDIDKLIADVLLYCNKNTQFDIYFSGVTRKVVCESDNDEKLTSRAIELIKEAIKITCDSEDTVDTEDIFLSLKTFIIDQKERKEIVKLVCKHGNAKLLGLICKGDNVYHSNIHDLFKYDQLFLGFETIEELLYYAIDNSCNPEIVQTIAVLIYKHAHPVYNGREFIANYDPVSSNKQEVEFFKSLLSQVIKRDLKDTVLVILGGDIYHCVRLALEDGLSEKYEFKEAYEMVQNIVKDKIKKYVGKSDNNLSELFECKKIESLKDLQEVLKRQKLLVDGKLQEVKIGVKNPRLSHFIAALTAQGIFIKKSCKLQDVVEELKKHGLEIRVTIKIEPVLVGAIISTLFFREEKYGFILQEKPTPPQLTQPQKSKKDQELKKLKNEELQKNAILELIKSLNKSNHVSSNWFFKEILVDILSDGEKSDKLKKLCILICKKSMQELIREKKIDEAKLSENMMKILDFIGYQSFAYQTLVKDDYTYKLTNNDIKDIAKSSYGWEDGVFFTCIESVDFLKTKLQEYQKEIKKNSNLTFTSILYDKNKEHCITLVIKGNKSYYYDPLNKFSEEDLEKIKNVVRGVFEIEIQKAKVVQKEKQYNDYDCGVLVLENAKAITDFFKKKEGRDISSALWEPSKEQIREKREKFAKKLSPVAEKSTSQSKSQDPDIVTNSKDEARASTSSAKVRASTIAKRKNSLGRASQRFVASPPTNSADSSSGPSRTSTPKSKTTQPSIINYMNLNTLSDSTSKKEQSDTKRDETINLTESDEYIGPSSGQFLTETNKGNFQYKLSGQDITDIAKCSYRWMEPINGNYSEDTDQGVFFTCTDVSSLKAKFESYKEAQQKNKDLIFTSIINIGNSHWVTLVVARNPLNNEFRAYYCDSFGGNQLPGVISNVLKETLGIDKNDIGVSKVQQQFPPDGHNCGIFALKNAKRITKMIKDKSFTEINVKLLRYKPNAEELIKKRKKFADALRNYKQNSKMLEDKLCASTSSDSQSSAKASSNTSQQSTIALESANPEQVTEEFTKEFKNNFLEQVSNSGHTKHLTEGANNKDTNKTIEQFNNNGGNTMLSLNEIKKKNYLLLAEVPSTEALLKRGNSGYRDRLLSEIFNSAMLSKDARYNDEKKGNSNSAKMNTSDERMDTSLNDSLDERMDTSLNDSGSAEEECDGIREGYGLYREGYDFLVNLGDPIKALDKFRQSGEKQVLYSHYAFALVTFKELIREERSGTLEQNKHRYDPIKAIEYLMTIKEQKEEKIRPACYFLLGVVQSYLGDMIFRHYNKNVSDITKQTDTQFFFNKFLKNQDKSQNQLCGFFEGKHLKYMVQCSQYEIFAELLSRKGAISQKEEQEKEGLLDKLKKSTFAQAHYRYAVYLLESKSLWVKDYNKGVESIIKHLNLAIKNSSQEECKDAEFLLYSLPLKKETSKYFFKHKNGFLAKEYLDKLENYAKCYQDKEAAALVAKEYTRGICTPQKGFTIIKMCDVSKAREVLSNAGATNKLKELDVHRECYNTAMKKSSMNEGDHYEEFQKKHPLVSITQFREYENFKKTKDGCSDISYKEYEDFSQNFKSLSSYTQYQEMKAKEISAISGIGNPLNASTPPSNKSTSGSTPNSSGIGSMGVGELNLGEQEASPSSTVHNPSASIPAQTSYGRNQEPHWGK